jgi:hypothetical protein
VPLLVVHVRRVVQGHRDVRVLLPQPLLPHGERALIALQRLRIPPSIRA